MALTLQCDGRGCKEVSVARDFDRMNPSVMAGLPVPAMDPKVLIGTLPVDWRVITWVEEFKPDEDDLNPSEIQGQLAARMIREAMPGAARAAEAMMAAEELRKLQTRHFQTLRAHLCPACIARGNTADLASFEQVAVHTERVIDDSEPEAVPPA
jgi:hypothetical protein